MPHLDDFNGVGWVVDGIDNAKLTLPNSVAPLGSRNLFTARGAWLGDKRGDAVDDALAILFLTKRFDLRRGGRLY